MRQESSLDQLVEAFIASGRARGLSPRTTRGAYGFALNRVLLPWCQTEGITAVAQIDRRALDRLSTHLLEVGGARGPLSRYSVRSYLKSVNQFLIWAAADGNGNVGRAQMPKLPQRLLETLTREELTAMEDAAPTERDKLIIRLLADTGLRVGELVGLRVNDLVDIDRSSYLRVVGKGSKERKLPVPRLGRRIEKYIRGTAGVRTSPYDQIFVTLRRARNGKPAPITHRAVQTLIRDAADRAGIRKRVYPHLLRHSYATWALNRGLNPITLATLLGHSSLAMIQQVYVHQTAGDTFEMVQRLLDDRA